MLHHVKRLVSNREIQAAVAAMDKVAAKQYVEMAKMFDQVEALAAMDTANADELDLSEVPPSPQPYRRVEQPTTFIGGLESRMNRMNTRMAEQYKAAILVAKAGHPVAVAELPSLPDMPPLPPQNQEPTLKTSTPSVRPPPAVGPLAASGQPGASRNSTQLQFLIIRQNEFKQAAIHAKSKGNLELAKKYLLEAKGFDKMIAAAKAGLPVSIKATPIPPQVSTSQATLQPRIVPTTSSTTGIEGRGETLSMMEKSLIEQVQLAENSRMRFTRLGDVGKVKLFEDWAKVSKQDLLLVREVAKQGLKLPKFHYESRHIPCADLFPDLAEDVLELSIIRCRVFLSYSDAPLPSGYEPNDANLFVKFVFPYPSDANQSGKTKYVPGTQNPEFDEIAMLQIGTRRARSHKLMRVLKRIPLKLEVYQKGSFLRSDKLLGTCEWKLEQLESNALLEETLPLKEGRKAVGGLLTLKIRIREPLGDAKLTSIQHRWLVLDN
uniref:C2 domain-containing protein n=1 Tax=Angiostrongylus cantonensis TaxID=6313 RepID=A0A0K0DEF2_ANGCA